MKSYLAILLFTILCMPLAGQTPTFEELEFESDSVTSAYKSAGKNFVLVRSKRGTNGLNKTPAADAILSAEVTEIVLVFSELNPSDIAEREEANQERWENLLKTYPEFFQFSTTYKNVCQCNNRGDSAAFKRSQGFYVYINGEVPKVAEPKASVPPPAENVKTAAVEKTEEKKTEKKKEETPPATKPLKTAEKEVAVTDKTEVKITPPPAVVEKHETPASPVSETKENNTSVNEEKEESTPVAKETRKKPVSTSNKPRKARNAKACRPACFGSGDEDLNTFFKDNIPLTKKQRRKAKNWVANVRLQISFDGSIKKAMVTGSNEEFNLQLQEVFKSMTNWNAAVKNGLTVKSEVRFTVKYDKETKSMKPFDMIMNPKASPKCPCVSDSELFD